MKLFSMRSLGLVGAAALLSSALVARAGDAPKTGAAPPEIKAEGFLNAEKGAVTLADLKGKVVVVEFWATWCPPCRKSIPHLVELHKQKAKDGLVIVGLTNEAKDKVEPFAKKMEMSYIVGYGSQSGEAYGVEGIPTAFVVGADGKIAWSGHPMEPAFEEAVNAALAAAGKGSKDSSKKS